MSMRREIRALSVMTAALLLAGCSSSPSNGTETTPFQGTPNDYNRAVVACLNDDGWGAVLVEQEDGSVHVQAPQVTTSEQQRQFLAASQDCTESLPPVPEPLTDEQLREAYESWGSIHTCLEDAGYDLPPAPSFQTYVDDLRAGNASATPHGLITGASYEQQQEAERLCPRDPDAWW